jgi:hypothetical protein
LKSISGFQCPLIPSIWTTAARSSKGSEGILAFAAVKEAVKQARGKPTVSYVETEISLGFAEGKTP